MASRKYDPAAKQRNAARGALRSWCPECKRKGALHHDTNICRRCGYHASPWKERQPLVKRWVKESPAERDPLDVFGFQRAAKEVQMMIAARRGDDNDRG